MVLHWAGSSAKVDLQDSTPLESKYARKPLKSPESLLPRNAKAKHSLSAFYQCGPFLEPWASLNQKW